MSGVEERDEEEEDQSYAQTHDNTSTYGGSVSQPGEDTLQQDSLDQESYNQTDDSLLDNGDISGSTPRAPRPRSATDDRPNFAGYPSPYEALKQELKGTSKKQDATQEVPATPGARSRIPDMSMTPTSSPFDPTTYMQSIQKPGADPLLHRILDKNYRIHATPHTAQKVNKTPANKPSWRDSDSPMSSPPVAAPQLRSEIFGSPIRQQYNRPIAPRTPGISVQTPAKGKGKEAIPNPPLAKKDEISWESDSDEDAEGVYREMGMSPPKTIQFNLPQSKLLQTPGMSSSTLGPLYRILTFLAREASKRIVEDLLTTAGAGFDDSLDDSPSMVRMKDDMDDSF